MTIASVLNSSKIVNGLTQAIRIDPTEEWATGCKLMAHYDEDRKVVVLDYVFVPVDERRFGFGERLVNRVLMFADDAEVEVRLSPSDVFGVPVPVLQKFYRKLGFVGVPGSDEMRYIP